MTDLREQMHDTVDAQHLDLVALAARARQEGAALRRRRRLTIAGSSLAVVAMVAVGAVATTVLPDRTPVNEGGDARPSRGADHVPDGGDAWATALTDAVTDVVPGSASSFAGLAPAEPRPYSSGTFTFELADGSAPGQVSIDLQDKSFLARNGKTPEEGFFCFGHLRDHGDCELSTLADGSMLRTYAEHRVAASGDRWERLCAERLVGDLRVVVCATNGFDHPANQYDVTRPQAVLSTEQLTAVASGPWPAVHAGLR